MTKESISRIRSCDCSRHIILSMKCFFLQKNCIIFLLLFISRSVAFLLPSNSIPVINRRIQSCSSKENVAILFSRIDKFDSEPEDVGDDADYLTKDTNQGREKDDITEDEADDDYIGKFISDALEEKASTDETSSEDEPSSLIETKRMIEKQQEQIDLLMNLVKQQNKGELSSSQEAISRRRSSIEQSSRSLQPKSSTNVAPLKANLFIDGTWLYYSLNTRNPDRCPIIKKFGKGWQNNYKVDWLALPKLICAQMEKQRYSKVSQRLSCGFRMHFPPSRVLPPSCNLHHLLYSLDIIYKIR